MTPNDFKDFSAIWISTAEYYGKEACDAVVKMAFRLLINFEIEEIEAALHAHMLDPVDGKWQPKAADVVAKIKGQIPKASEIVGLARAANTPLGCFARMIIGKWDLDNQDSFYLNQRGEQVRAELPEFIARARQGRYTDGEIRLMKYRNINLSSELCPGLPGPSSEAAQIVHERALALPSFTPASTDNPKDSKEAATAALRLVHSESARRE